MPRKSRLACVRVTRVGTSEPQRFKIDFVADEFEGRAEWVSRARLQCPWPVAGEWVAERKAWHAASAAEEPADPESEAVDSVLRLLVPPAIARREPLSTRKALVTVVRPDLLAALAGTTVDDAVAGGWWHHQVCTVPWETTVRLCRHIVARNELRVLPWLRELEQASVRGRKHGEWTQQRGQKVFVPPSAFGENYDSYEREMFELIREWLGAQVASREDELATLRAELDRVTAVAQAAVSALRHEGLESRAWSLQKDLRPGTTRKEWLSCAPPT